MAKLAPKMLQSYMAKAKEDADFPYDDEVDVENEGGDDYIEEASEELAEHAHSGDYEAFMKSLFEHAGAIQAAAGDIFLTVVDEDLPSEAKASLMAALAELPPDLVDGIKQHFAQLDVDELHDVVESLEESGAIENDATMVPFLYWAARVG